MGRWSHNGIRTRFCPKLLCMTAFLKTPCCTQHGFAGRIAELKIKDLRRHLFFHLYRAQGRNFYSIVENGVTTGEFPPQNGQAFADCIAGNLFAGLVIPLTANPDTGGAVPANDGIAITSYVAGDIRVFSRFLAGSLAPLPTSALNNFCAADWSYDGEKHS
jgi:hypothetical protein